MKIKEHDFVSSVEQKGCNKNLKEQQDKKAKMKDLSSVHNGKESLMNFIFGGKDSQLENPLDPKKEKVNNE